MKTRSAFLPKLIILMADSSDFSNASSAYYSVQSSLPL